MHVVISKITTKIIIKDCNWQANGIEIKMAKKIWWSQKRHKRRKKEIKTKVTDSK